MLISKDRFSEMFMDKLQSLYGVSFEETGKIEKYVALSSLIKEFICKSWVGTHEKYDRSQGKHVYYLSIEFLPGKFLGTNLLNLGLKEVCREALKELNISLEEIEDMEREPGLGNGGLGRLAACFMDSMASLDIPCNGCGIRYKYGLFEQKILNGYQVELPDNWLNFGCVWEIRKSDEAVEVKFGGEVNTASNFGRLSFNHNNYESVLAVPYDIPIVGYKNNSINTLRLWSAEVPQREAGCACLSRCDYQKAMDYKNSIEAISEVLYPDDKSFNGKVLRLKQQYFLVSAALQSLVKSYKKKGGFMDEFYEKISIHINDTHPALAIPELMRILLDEENMSWEEAWRITCNTISYTNHTILPEALEKWEIDIMKPLLPRIFMIIEEINERFCKELWDRYPGNWNKIREMAVIVYGYVRMANLAIVGSYSINGVAKIHTEILKKQVMKDFYDFYPYKFNNKTNGISHRAWLIKSNPMLSDLITEAIGDSWIKHPIELNTLNTYVDDSSFQEKFKQIKGHNKRLLSKYINDKYYISIDEESIFDVQVKRIHEYKRQLLNLFHIMDMYNRFKADVNYSIVPRTFIFGGKAAPGYYMAKQIIKLINTVAKAINQDKDIKDKIKVVFLENYSVSLGEKIFPAADISEQISTASKEASGTGNMKFMMNGAVTIGTLDGANIEIRDVVGEDNFITFGLNADEVISYYNYGGYSSIDVYNNDLRIKKLVDSLVNGSLPAGNEEFRFIYDSLLLHNDQYFILKDFSSYVNAQNTINERFTNKNLWYAMCIKNTSKSGIFSSDRTVGEYAAGIWKVRPIVVQP